MVGRAADGVEAVDRQTQQGRVDAHSNEASKSGRNRRAAYRFIPLGLRAGEDRADRKKHTAATPKSWGGSTRGPNLLGEIHRAIPGCGSVSGLGEIGPNHECNGLGSRISKSSRGSGSPL